MFGAHDATTFLGLPARSITGSGDELGDAQIAVIGAPCATPYPSVGPYCAAAPAAIRRSSWTYSSSVHHMNFDLGGPTLPDGVVAVDLGDVEWDEHDPAGNRDRIRATCAAVLGAGAVPVVLGGDDSIPIPVLEAYAGRGPLTIVQIDAHIDWREEVNGERMGLSSTMRRASEMAHVGEMFQIGRRGAGSARPADAQAALDRGVHFVSAHDVHRHGVEAIAAQLPTGGSTFVTIDVDGLDPAVMPGVIGPEPGGLTYFQAIEIIDAVAERSRLVGFDVVEFVPERDVNALGALTAFRLTAHALGRIARQAVGDSPGVIKPLS
jgi:agmatinase